MLKYVFVLWLFLHFTFIKTFDKGIFSMYGCWGYTSDGNGPWDWWKLVVTSIEFLFIVTMVPKHQPLAYTHYKTFYIFKYYILLQNTYTEAFFTVCWGGKFLHPSYRWGKIKWMVSQDSASAHTADTIMTAFELSPGLWFSMFL